MSLRIRITSKAKEPLDEQRLVRLLIRQARAGRSIDEATESTRSRHAAPNEESP